MELKILLAFIINLILFSAKIEANKGAYDADVIIYGGTSAAVTAAVQVVRMGKTVIIVCPDIHLGGLSSGGLGFTDTGNKQVIGGLAREFYQHVYAHYQSDSAWKWQKKEEYGNKGQGTPAMDGAQRTMWIFEPHVAEQVFEGFIKKYHITVYRNEWLNRSGGVKMAGGKILSITMLSGKMYSGKMFIDASYEGDLMAAAQVRYHIGREANSVYGEEWNGVQVGILHHGHYFKTAISPYLVPNEPSSGLLPRVSAQPPGKRGEGDNKIQAYCYRMCLSENPANQVSFSKPAGYEPKQYELLIRVFNSGWRETFNKFDKIPNKKTDVNNHGPFSTDNIGMNYDYPDASYEHRKKILNEHETYQKGLLYFLANDTRVPTDVRAEMNRWGLAKDEFTDNGNWPHQIYVREARRMVGSYVMTENEVLGKRAVPKPIGMGSYTLDSHNAQRYIKEDGYVQNEGDIGVDPKKPYQVAYGALVPKKEECTNLFVPVCVSSSHIAFGSMRMEPVFMILGQSSATAAVQAIENGQAVQDINYEVLKERLLKDHTVFEIN